MDNVLFALGIYFGLPFLLAVLARCLGFVVDVLAWLIHGPPPPRSRRPRSGSSPQPVARPPRPIGPRCA